MLNSLSSMIAESQLVRSRLEKLAFLSVDASGVQQPGMPPGGDPAAMGGMPPGGDPAAMGGMPGGMPPGGMPPGEMPGGGAPMDPAAMGGDPAMAGGMAPPPPPGIDPAMLEQIASAVAAKMGGGGSGTSMGASTGLKPKIDVNVTLLQILKMLARIADGLGIQIPASEMVATQGDLGQMAQQQQQPQPAQPQAIQPIEPIDPAGMPSAGGMPPEKTGWDLSHLARATRTVLNRQGFHFE